MLVAACSLQLVQAQDIITKRSGEKVPAKVLEITTAQVKYKHFDRVNEPLYTLNKSDILLIEYENDTEEVFDPANTLSTVDTPPTPNLEMYSKGQSDAVNFYKGYKAASTGTFVVSLLSPAVGLIPALATSTTPPKDKNLDFPSHELKTNPDYLSGYNQRSRKLKSNKVWTNWGIALGINVALYYMLVK